MRCQRLSWIPAEPGPRGAGNSFCVSVPAGLSSAGVSECPVPRLVPGFAGEEVGEPSQSQGIARRTFLQGITPSTKPEPPQTAPAANPAFIPPKFCQGVWDRMEMGECSPWCCWRCSELRKSSRTEGKERNGREKERKWIFPSSVLGIFQQHSSRGRSGRFPAPELEKMDLQSIPGHSCLETRGTSRGWCQGALEPGQLLQLCPELLRWPCCDMGTPSPSAQPHEQPSPAGRVLRSPKPRSQGCSPIPAHLSSPQSFITSPCTSSLLCPNTSPHLRKPGEIDPEPGWDGQSPPE